jgi:putative ABC transport system ATP-binding protein
MELLLGACEAAGSAVVFVSHDARLSARFDRSIALGVAT